MAQYYTDFSEYDPGASPHDWSDAWVPGGQTMSIVEDPDATGGKVMRHQVLEHNRRAWSWNRVPGSSEVDIRVRLRSDDARARFGPIARGGWAGSRDTEEGITWELFNGTDRDESEWEEERQEYRQIAWMATYTPSMIDHKGPKRPHGIGSVRGAGFFPWEAGEWYWMRLQARDEDGWITVRAKVWAGDEEPSIWTYDIQRTERAEVGSRGWVGITGQTTPGNRDFDVFAVGTDGDPAPLG